MKMRRMGPETTELGFQDLGFPPYVLGTLAENLSHFGYSLVLSPTQEHAHARAHTRTCAHTHTHTHTADKAVFPCWLFQVPRAGNRLQGNSQEIMPSR